MAKGNKRRVNGPTKRISSNAETPDYLARIGGYFLLFIGAIGVIFTSPLSLVLGFIGFLGGLLFGKAWDAGFVGARIGSLGSLDLTLYGLELTNATVENEEPSQKQLLATEKLSIKIDSDSEQEQERATRLKKVPRRKAQEPSPLSSASVSTVSTTFFATTEKEPLISGPKPHGEGSPKQIDEKFPQADTKAGPSHLPRLTDGRKVGDRYIANLIAINLNTTLAASAFLDRLDQMSDKDIQDFVNQLDSEGLESVWLHFNDSELEPSKREYIRHKFSQLIEALSEEQFKAALSTPNFLHILNKDAYGETTAETSQVPSDKRKVGDQYITNLISINQDTTLVKSEFLDRLAQMSPKDLQIFVSQLDSRGLDSVWFHFNGLEIEPSKREYNRDKLAQLIKALSKEQLKAAFNSATFLNILNKDAYAETAATTLTRKQLQLFASDAKRQELLNTLVKKLKPSPHLLGKLLAIMPYANETLREALLQQIAHLPYRVSFNKKLAKLAQHYIDINNKIFLADFDPNQPKVERRPSKWATVQAATTPVYNTAPIKREDIKDDAFDEFIQHLNSESYLIYEQSIVEVLSHLPDYRIKMLVERASLPEFDSLLDNLWFIEAKTNNALSFLNNREERLKIVLLNLSEPQLIRAEKQNKFWEIFKNKQEPFCKMAANVLTPEQFQILIANTPLERHENFAVLISQINRDTQADKARLKKVIEAILPYTTPWLAIDLEWKINSFNGPVYELLINKLKKHLSESFQNPKVAQKYSDDHELDKQAISNLVIKSEPVASLGL
ncbi:hypothetical protein BN59_01433 [Legionella massiliensis]|uniref:Uncharacterized protein n=1 Tax=Legionella massiliensis TaxID=1034943 RepID=A0A078KVX8_9GAMM|nr:hypothetical protein [Legionella massiliensis]CDZ77151.1 hypothetical protein BN59_01433 [Legionella massiliensis]CEE12889.1 hypothetical protein BN1094_01433 [Legionella massiliensis]